MQRNVKLTIDLERTLWYYYGVRLLTSRMT